VQNLSIENMTAWLNDITPTTQKNKTSCRGPNPNSWDQFIRCRMALSRGREITNHLKQNRITNMAMEQWESNQISMISWGREITDHLKQNHITNIAVDKWRFAAATTK
jgi:hypothetical protein